MGSIADLDRIPDSGRGAGDAEESSLRPVTVLVTGYGPFLDQFPVNSSWSIASSLPSHLPPTQTCPTPIRILVPHQYLKVAYHPVIAAVPTLLSDEYSDPPPDIILHIGMAAGRTYYTLETTAYRDGYDRLKDVEGMTFSKQENKEIWGDCPRILQPGWDCEEVWRRWRQGVRAELDLRPSDDPGNFMCGFIYYASLSTLWKRSQGVENDEQERGEEEPRLDGNATSRSSNMDQRESVEKQRKHQKHVMFLHVPDSEKMGHISNGVEVAVGMIRALVESRRRGLCGDTVDGSKAALSRKIERAPRDLKKMW